jgi:hypothetical protein
MTDVAVYGSPNLPARIGTPGTTEFDSWISVASDVIKLARHIADTPFVPDGLRGSAPAVAAAILAGRELGLAPLTSLANIHIIKGKPTLSAVLMRALVQSKGHQWQDVDVSDVRAIVRGRRVGESDWTEVTFTQAHAKLAGIDLGRYPADKLYARATSRLARRKFADVIMGMPYSEDEIEDGVTEAGEVIEGAAPAAIEAPKAKAAQRRTRQAAEPIDRPTGAPSAAASAGATQDPQPPAPAKTAPGGQPSKPASSDGLPPLPGEEPVTEEPDIDKDAPGTATVGKGGQLTALWTVLRTEFGFGEEEKAQARSVCEEVTGRKLQGATTGNLSFNEARAVLDTLANWKSLAEANLMTPREVMVTHLAAIAESRGPDAGGEAAAERAFQAGEAG